MYPTLDAPYGGIFISHRIVALRAAGVEIDPFAVQVEDGPVLRLIRRAARRPAPRVWGTHTVPGAAGDVVYQVISVREGLVDKVINRLTAYRSQVRRIERAVARAVGPGSFSALHVHWAFTTGAAVQRAAKRLSLPVILTCHGSDINVLGADPRFRSQVIAALEGSDEVEFVSQALSRKAKELGYSGRSAHVVPNGVWIEEHCASTLAPVFDGEGLQRVLYVGSLREIKGADRLPAILDVVGAQALSPVEFRIVGEGELMAEIRAWAEHSGAEVLGAVPPETVKREMRGADVLVMPSRNEGWPNVVLEAHAVGLPVVAANAGGTAEAVGDPRVILPVDASVEEFASRILDVLEGRISVDAKQLAARAAEFDWRRLALSTRAAYERVAHDC